MVGWKFPILLEAFFGPICQEFSNFWIRECSVVLCWFQILFWNASPRKLGKMNRFWLRFFQMEPPPRCALGLGGFDLRVQKLSRWWKHGRSFMFFIFFVNLKFTSILLMAEILHHLGCIKPCKYWDKLPINWCRISATNSTEARVCLFRELGV